MASKFKSLVLIILFLGLTFRGISHAQENSYSTPNQSLSLCYPEDWFIEVDGMSGMIKISKEEISKANSPRQAVISILRSQLKGETYLEFFAEENVGIEITQTVLVETSEKRVVVAELSFEGVDSLFGFTEIGDISFIGILETSSGISEEVQQVFSQVLESITYQSATSNGSVIWFTR